MYQMQLELLRVENLTIAFRNDHASRSMVKQADTDDLFSTPFLPIQNC